MWPIPAPTTYQHAVSTLKSDLRTLDVKGSCDPKHANCKPIRNLQDTLYAVTGGINSIVTESQARHLAAQARKSGLAT